MDLVCYLFNLLPTAAMAVIKCRGATRKLGSIGFGRRVVGLKLANNQRQYTIHEDLLCANSKLFTRRLQSNRKPVEGDCAICTEILHKNDDITFCKNGCGNNFHAYCIDSWKASQTGATTCPMCRKLWKRPLKTMELLDMNLDPRLVELYFNWLYTGKIQDIEGINYYTDEFNVKALEAWSMAETIEDEDFKHAIIADIIMRQSHMVSTGFGIESASAAFDLHDSSDMRDFAAEAFLININENFFMTDAALFEPNFRNAVAHAALRTLGKEKPTHKALLEKFTKGKYEMVGVEGAGGNTGNA